VITATVNKTLFGLVCEQNTLLQGVELPYFTREMLQTLDAVSTDAHSYSDELFAKLEQQRRVLCALLSLRFAVNSGHIGGAQDPSTGTSNPRVAQFVDDYMDQHDVGSSGGSGKKRRKISIGVDAVDAVGLQTSSVASPMRASRFSSASPNAGSAVMDEINFDRFDGAPSTGGRGGGGVHMTNNPFSAVPPPAPVPGHVVPPASSLPPAPNSESRKAPLLQKLALMLNKAKKT